MEHKTLVVEERKELTKGANGRLRRAGKIPAVVYGVNAPLNITVDARQFSREFKVISESQLITLQLGKKNVEVLLKDFQEDIITGNLTHIDFVEVNSNKAVKAHVAIHLKGNAVGVREGGLLEHNLHEVEIECLPKDLPSELLVDVSSLGVGASVHLRDVSAPKGVKILGNADTIVCHVINPKAMAAQEASVAAPEAAAEPAPAAEAKK